MHCYLRTPLWRKH
ncbi:hypothetical protein D0812_18615 [Vibrio owensii]|uniref:Uncharacterized protein n=1 Tax=Vibrio owensii TaxID=696485 RepID=A0AAP9KDP7_9VIBR|nr:hypothetical protein D0812_18615 [Vibrio owensii]NOJ16314.1 hypothetical protein [Vibrio jasicida]AYO23992.1 hypothetical protein D0856_20660 [Vibrio owensii]NOI71031.1 hypothetical protein [Vibrio owensii]QGH51024.1 hypothetical protein APZ19_26385 [Vibrio owensii]